MANTWTVTGLMMTAFWGCTNGQGELAAKEEPLLTLRGTVTESVQWLSSDLVPALGFTPYVTKLGYKNFFISGDTEGTFPQSFLMRVYDRLPEEALTTLTQSEPRIAVGGVTAVAQGHPRWLDWTQDAEGHAKVCADTGQCSVPDETDCQYAGSAGPSCLSTYISGQTWGDYGYAEQYLAIYLDGPAVAGGVYSSLFAGGERIPSGYSLIRLSDVLSQLTAAEQGNYITCQKRAVQTALNEFNHDHDSSFTDPSMISDGGEQTDVQMLADWDGSMLSATVAEGCVVPGAQTIVHDTDSKPIEFQLSQHGSF
jgi:hypothetical protein